MTRRHHSPAITWMIDGWDGHDPWGSAMSMAWAVAEVSAALDEHRPAQTLEVRWGLGGYPTEDELQEAINQAGDYSGGVSYESSALYEGYLAGEVTTDDMRFAARVLNRYLDLCKAAGFDY